MTYWFLVKQSKQVVIIVALNNLELQEITALDEKKILLVDQVLVKMSYAPSNSPLFNSFANSTSLFITVDGVRGRLAPQEIENISSSLVPF